MDKTIIVIPAKGGSKNMTELARRPLLGYVLTTVNQLGYEVVVSTDDEAIAAYVTSWGIEVSVVSHEGPLQETVASWEQGYDNIVLMQPTSPFIRAQDIRAVIKALDENPDASSAQTITRVRHNSHDWNQRTLDLVKVRWLHEHSHDAQLRRKQNQPERWKFGNVVAVRSSELARYGFFAYPSIGIPIHHFFAFDVDDEDDFKLAEAMLVAGLVS